MKLQTESLLIEHRTNLYEALEDTRKVPAVNHGQIMKGSEDAR